MAERNDASRRGRNPAEWVTLAVSLLILAAFVGAAFYEHFQLEEQSGAVLQVEVHRDQAERRGDRFYLPFDATNTGADPASNVALHFEVLNGGEVIEESDAVIPFLPSDAVESGEVVLMSDPAQYEVTAQVGNYLTP